MFKKIDHIEIVTDELHRTIDFYNDVLGFKLRERQRVDRSGLGVPMDIVYMDLNGTVIELMSYDGASPDPAPEREHLGYRMMALEVEDMQKAADYLFAKGIKIIWGPKESPKGIRAEICDPNGNHIELRQWFECAQKKDNCPRDSDIGGNGIGLPEKFYEVLRHEGLVALASIGNDGQHLVNTWNSYVQVTDDERLLLPVGRMNKTEKNVVKNDQVLLTLGAREVTGMRGAPGTGFLIRGTAEFLSAGRDFDTVKTKFPWARAALRVTIGNITQTL